MLKKRQSLLSTICCCYLFLLKCLIRSTMCCRFVDFHFSSVSQKACALIPDTTETIFSLSLQLHISGYILFEIDIEKCTTDASHQLRLVELIARSKLNVFLFDCLRWISLYPYSTWCTVYRGYPVYLYTFFSIFKGRRYFADFQSSRVVSVPINRDNRDFTVIPCCSNCIF